MTVLRSILHDNFQLNLDSCNRIHNDILIFNCWHWKVFCTIYTDTAHNTWSAIKQSRGTLSLTIHNWIWNKTNSVISFFRTLQLFDSEL